MIEEKLLVLDALPQISPSTLLACIFIESAEMGGNAGVQSADDVIEYFFLEAHLIEEIRSFEAVFLVYKFPNVGAVVISEGLDILVDVEVLAPIVGFVLNVPDPPVSTVSSLNSP